MPSFYDILGVREDATDYELRHAFYLAALRIHPDVNPGPDAAEDMRRLNHAWSVLGDPTRRRAYDRDRRQPLAPTRPVRVEPSPYYEFVVHPMGRLLRPSVLIVAVLFLIFVVTAYAGPSSNDRNPSPASPATSPAQTQAAGDRLGQCLKPLPGYDAVVPCSSANDGEVVGQVAAFSQCPTGSRPYQLAGQAGIVCLAPAGTVDTSPETRSP